MTVTYDATHHRSLQLSPITRLMRHLCHEPRHPRLHNPRSYARAVSVTLREITADNRDPVLALSVAPQQERFVSSVRESLAHADAYPEANPWCHAVYTGGTPVGFVMLSWNVVPQPPDIIGPWFLWKLLVDRGHQGLGYGAEVVQRSGQV